MHNDTNFLYFCELISIFLQNHFLPSFTIVHKLSQRTMPEHVSQIMKVLLQVVHKIFLGYNTRAFSKPFVQSFALIEKSPYSAVFLALEKNRYVLGFTQCVAQLVYEVNKVLFFLTCCKYRDVRILSDIWNFGGLFQCLLQIKASPVLMVCGNTELWQRLHFYII